MYYFRENDLTLLDRNDLYLMQIAKEIRAGLTSANPTILDMKLPVNPGEVPRPKTKDEYLKQSINAWLAVANSTKKKQND